MNKFRNRDEINFELFWWREYLERKSKSEYFDELTEYWEKFLSNIRSNLGLRNLINVLDVECGPAGIFMIMQDYNCTAVDPYFNQYEKEIKYFRKSDYPNTIFRNEYGRKFIPLEKYDLIFLNKPNLNNESIMCTVRNLKYAAANGAKIILTIDLQMFEFINMTSRDNLSDIFFNPSINDLMMHIEEECDIRIVENFVNGASKFTKEEIYIFEV